MKTTRDLQIEQLKKAWPEVEYNWEELSPDWKLKFTERALKQLLEEVYTLPHSQRWWDEKEEEDREYLRNWG